MLPLAFEWFLTLWLCLNLHTRGHNGGLSSHRRLFWNLIILYGGGLCLGVEPGEVALMAIGASQRSRAEQMIPNVARAIATPVGNLHIGLRRRHNDFGTIVQLTL